MAGGLIAVVAVLVGIVLLIRPGPIQATDGDKKTVTVKVYLPMAEAKVYIDGAEQKGSGIERTHKATTTKDTILLSTMWEPNNYTKITRMKKIAVKDGDSLTVDLRKETDIKDDIVVRWVPTPQDVVEKMCEVAKVGKNDVVYDLGCGDAVMLITAVKKFGAKRGVGVDIDPKMVKIAKEKAKESGVAEKVDIRQGDVLKVDDLPDASVVLLYMGDDINNRLKPILKAKLKQGSRVVSHRFLMGDDWKPDRTWTVNSTAGYPCDVHLWIIKGEEKKSDQ